VTETREVRAEGCPLLFIQLLSEGKQLTGQGNLSPLVIATILSFALSGITDTEPMNGSSMSAVGSQLRRDFLFGSQQSNSWPGSYAANGTMITNASSLPVANFSAGCI
jgi:hypothetical protein